MIQLRSIRLRASSSEHERQFPFTVPVIAALAEATLTFPSDVTFFVGENGSGKSTLLEAIAYAAELPAVGGVELATDPTLAHGRLLGGALGLEWSAPRTRRGFFLRAEDFFGFAQRVDRIRVEFEQDLRRIDEDSSLSAKARGFARMAPARELGELRRRYGEGVDTQSHGEQFLGLFSGRIAPNGLYLLDEPEAPLSPNRQLSFLSMIMHYVREEKAQFIIATHSPILMAVPGATIYTFDDGAIQTAAYDSLDHVTITRDFLNDPEAFLRHL
jgi:predicted ATPase